MIVRTTTSLVALLLATSTLAQEPADYSGKSDEELIALLRQSGDAWLENSCGLGVPLLGELHARHRKEDRFLRGFLLARVLCADSSGDYTGAAAHFAEMESRFGSNDLLGLGLYVDHRADRPDAMLARLDRLARQGSGETFEALSFDQYSMAWRLASRHGKLDEFERNALRLFESPGYPKFDADLQASIASRALKPAAQSARADLVADVLSQIRNPISYSGFLASREYEAIWPQLEARVGEHYSLITEEYREWALARLENEPTERDRFSDAAHALYFNGLFEEAVALARRWRERPGAFERIEEGDGWAINIEAYALDSLGRTAEADALFDQLAALDPKEHHWVVNFVINRATRLVGQNRADEGLEAARLARTVAQEYGSTYAKMLVASAHACALAGLGRDAEAEPELEYLRENREEAVTVAAEALMCLDRDEEALAMLIEGIESERTRANVIEGLQSGMFELFYTRSLLPDTSEFLVTSPELRAAFERHARIIPEHLTPAASLKRVPLKP